MSTRKRILVTGAAEFMGSHYLDDGLELASGNVPATRRENLI